MLCCETIFIPNGNDIRRNAQTAANILLDIEDFRTRVSGLREVPRADDWVSHKPYEPNNGAPSTTTVHWDITSDLEAILTNQPQKETDMNLARHENVEENVLGLRRELQNLSRLIVACGKRAPYPDDTQKRKDVLKSSSQTSCVTKHGSIIVWLFTSPSWHTTKLHRSSRPPLDITTTYIYVLLDIERLFSNVFARVKHGVCRSCGQEPCTLNAVRTSH